MPNQDVVQRDDELFSAQLSNFAAKLPNYEDELNLSPEQIQQAKKDAAYFEWVLKSHKQYVAHTKNWRAHKDDRRRSAKNAPLGSAPVAPVLLPMPELVPGDIEGRFRQTAAFCKLQPGYTEAIGLDLWIVAPKSTNPDLLQKKPVFSAELSAGHPLLKWKKDGMEGIEIYISTDGGEFHYLDFDGSPNYLDKRTPLPLYGETATWKYKCIYRYKGEQVGQWSDEVAVMVRGV